PKQSIGTVGKTGNATAAHLHFEMMVDGEYVDPASFMK
ncbi:MAG: M23 family metallopeptidase, partial [Clostridia bacterium]|nr:M23 family metallopeptidase [Clostridia bacterium]